MRFNEIYEADEPWAPEVPPVKLDPARKGLWWLDKGTHNLAAKLAAASLRATPYTPKTDDIRQQRYAQKYGTGSTFNVSPKELYNRQKAIDSEIRSEEYRKKFAITMDARLGRDRQDFLNKTADALPLDKFTHAKWVEWINHEVKTELKTTLEYDIFDKIKNYYTALFDQFATVIMNSTVFKDPKKRIENDLQLQDVLYNIGAQMFKDVKDEEETADKIAKAAADNMAVANRRAALNSTNKKTEPSMPKPITINGEVIQPKDPRYAQITKGQNLDESFINTITQLTAKQRSQLLTELKKDLGIIK